jgi:hypothetical protein
MGGKPRAPVPRGHVRVGSVVIPDPTKPHVHADMICARCHHAGMLIVPELAPKAVCLAGCPKPWHCTKCEMEAAGEAGPPLHATWCESATAVVEQG